MSRFKTPPFWYRARSEKPGLFELTLSPLSYLYDLGHSLKQASISSQRAGVPVLCVGNIVAGGSGKTPSVAALHAVITGHGLVHAPFVLTRGYGGSLSGPLLVEPAQHRAEEVGDEPLLLAARGLKVCVSRDRVAGARFLRECGADLIVMDDGFQNPALHKDLSFLVIDGQSGLGNARLIPAGPLRERPEAAYARASAVILIGQDRAGIRDSLPDSLPVFAARIVPENRPDTGRRYCGFAGLGWPEKFYTTLQEAGLDVSSFHAFADHHPYSPDDLKRLRKQARKEGAVLLTTEKDYMRLKPAERVGIEVLRVNLVFEEPETVCVFLQAALRKAQEGAGL